MTDAPRPRDLGSEAVRGASHGAVAGSRREPSARGERPRVLRCLPLFLLALALPPAAFAMDPRWTLLHEDAGGGGYIDLASVQRNEGFVEAWMLVDYVEARSIRGVRRSQSNSALAKVRIDCAGRRSGILALELRADRHGEGDVVFQHSLQTPDMVPVQSDPSMIRALELVCDAGQPATLPAPARTRQP